MGKLTEGQRTRRRAPARSGSNARRFHSAQLALELLDLVAEAGRGLELQLRGGRVHLVTELADQRHEVAPGLAPGTRRRLACPLGGRAGAGGQAGDRGLAAGLLTPAAADQLLGVGVLPDDRVEDVGDLLAQ